MQQGREGVQVEAFEGIDIAPQQRLLGVVQRPRGFSSASADAASVARARCSALLTEATELPSSSATSRADQLSTSRRMSTARCRGASRWSAAMNASRTDSRATALSAGSPADASTRASGTGPIHVASGSPVPMGVSTLAGEARSIGRARRWLPLSRSRQTLVAMR